MIIGWKITYSDGSKWTDRNSPWEQAPREGVQFVTIYFQEDDGTKHKFVHRKHDYYWFHNGVLGAGGIGDLDRERIPNEVLKEGRQLPDEVYQEIERKELSEW